MKHLTLGGIAMGLLVFTARLTAAEARAPTYDFPIYKNQPSGRQLTGQHAPAATPALSPEAAQQKFTVPPGFEMRLFAAEPAVANPVAMTWDDRGRLWVVELYEYPLGAKSGDQPRDRIKILEDSDNDGRADKVTVFADGLNLATGLLLGYGGVFVGQAPHLLFLEDTNGDGKADKRTVLKTGFGLEDRHELLNSFTWGPDGQLWMTHGVFTHSKVKDPDSTNALSVTMNAAVARYHPRKKTFEVVADGTSNPWGVDFDRYGNPFVSACVIDHLFHMAPGGIYVRQGGTPAHPYAYQLLPSIVDHKHHMAAYAGVQIYQGDQYPADYRGTAMMGNIHANAIHQDRLTAKGSSFTASAIQDFVRANDGWFMPVSSQVGPDGTLWIMDWYDKYPCYQNANADPGGVDREHGRIWRVVYVGHQPGKSVPSHPPGLALAKLIPSELARLLEHPNIWHRRMAQRLLSERKDTKTRVALQQILKSSASLESRLFALWTLHSTEQLEGSTLDEFSNDPEPAIRAWVARLTSEQFDRIIELGKKDKYVELHGFDHSLARLQRLAADRDPTVRLAVATATRQLRSSSLTVDTPVHSFLEKLKTGPIVETLIQHSADAKDPLLPFMIWMAVEPGVATQPELALAWLKTNGVASLPLTGGLLKKIMRRVCDARNADFLDQAIDFLAGLADDAAALTLAGLEGLIEGQKGKAVVPTKPTSAWLAKLAASPNPELKARAQELGTLWGDAAALKAVLAKITDPKTAAGERIQAIHSARQTKTEAARDAMIEVLGSQSSDAVIIEAMRALSEIGGDNVANLLLQRWQNLSLYARHAAAETMASRAPWRGPFLAAVEQKTIAPGEIPVSVIRALVNSKEEAIRNRATKAIGRFRETDADKLKLIAAKKQLVVIGPVDLEAGHAIAQKTCFNCHKLHGEGAEVGPDLTGVGRSSLDALLANVIDPNQIIGKGYENIEVETKDGRSVSGRLVEDTDTRIKLLAAGPKEEVVSKADIATLRVSEMSVMPEGLEQMPDADFRNLIWFILNPPQDNKPLTPERRQELLGGDKPAAALPPPIDRESVALWNPQWRVLAPDFEGSPAPLPEYAGRQQVLMTHPYDAQKGAALERLLDLPADKKATLTFAVAAHDRGDWELRVRVNGKLIRHQLVNHAGARWKPVSVNLAPYAGQAVAVRLENCANDWAWEFGYWSNLEIITASEKVAAK